MTGRKDGDVAGRAALLCLTAARAERLDRERTVALLEQLGVLDELTDDERELVFADRDADPEVAQRFRWDYEACATLLWVLGHVEELPPPDTPSDGADATQLVLGAGSAQALAETARRRPDAELIAEADFLKHLIPGLKELAVEGYAMPQNVSFPVVCQRHIALQWVLDSEERDWQQITKQLWNELRGSRCEGA